MSQVSQGWRTNLLFSSPASLYVCNTFFICAQSLISIQHEKSEPTVCDFRGRAELSQFAHFRITIKIGKESTAEKSEREPGEGDLKIWELEKIYVPASQKFVYIWAWNLLIHPQERGEKKRGKFVNGDLFVSSPFFLLHLNGERKMSGAFLTPKINSMHRVFFE